MADFSVRSDAVNVEQIMEQIRSRIREKRGVDYTEEQIRELASVKLQKFLDPRGVRSDLLDQFRKTQPPYQPPDLPNYAFEDTTLFDSHRAPLRFVRWLLNPILKLFFNPGPLIQALHIQSRVNTTLAEREARLEASRRSTESLYYELIHNLVVETTRLGIEVKNLTMRIESLTSRLEFSERRARSLESTVVYKPQGELAAHADHAPRASGGQQQVAATAASNVNAQAAPGGQTGSSGPEGPGQRSRRRRRRRGRRSGPPASTVMSAPGGAAPQGGEAQSSSAESTDHGPDSDSDSPEDFGGSDDSGPDTDSDNSQ